MRLKVLTIIGAAGLLAGSSALAIAESAKPLAPGQQMQASSASATEPGASRFAPGHLKKMAGVKSAKQFAPGQVKKHAARTTTRHATIIKKKKSHVARGPQLKAKATTTGSGAARGPVSSSSAGDFRDSGGGGGY